MTEWSKSFVDWTEGDTAYLSVVFTWDLPKAYMRAAWLREQGYKVRAGGPACLLMPDYLAEVAEVNGPGVDALRRHNPDATFTSRGCIRKCKFCAVPKIEGPLVELDEWEPKPIVCDNNLLACSQSHFDKVIDRLKDIEDVDFNQGLDARLLTQYHADRLAKLNYSLVRIAWDHIKSEAAVLAAISKLLRAGIPGNKIRAYVLVGYDDTPDDALYRLETLKALGALPCLMRFQPLGALEKNSHLSPSWTEKELRKFAAYWGRQVWYGHIPFEQFDIIKRGDIRKTRMLDDRQSVMDI